MGYAQWIDIKIVAEDSDITLGEATLAEGQFYDRNVGRKPSDLNAGTLAGLTIRGGTSTHVAACGIADRDDGTKGAIGLYMKGRRMGKLVWDCTDLFSANSVRWISASPEMSAKVDGGLIRGAALGEVTLTCARAHARPTRKLGFNFNTANLGFSSL